MFEIADQNVNRTIYIDDCDMPTREYAERVRVRARVRACAYLFIDTYLYEFILHCLAISCCFSCDVGWCFSFGFNAEVNEPYQKKYLNSILLRLWAMW